jgi:hypothetical protein
MRVYEIVKTLLAAMPKCITDHMESIIIIVDKNPVRIVNDMYSGKILSIHAKNIKNDTRQIREDKLSELIKKEVKFSNKYSKDAFKSLVGNIFGIECSIAEKEILGYKFYNYELISDI